MTALPFTQMTMYSGADNMGYVTSNQPYPYHRQNTGTCCQNCFQAQESP